MLLAPQPRFLNMASIRSVTAKPPKMFTEARMTAMKPKTAADAAGAGREQRADDDHRADRVGDRHQGRVQRRRHRPDHVVADEHREHEDDQVEDAGVDGFHLLLSLRPRA